MKILLAGDSTVAHYDEKQAPMSSWGDGLVKILKDENIQIEVLNFAKPGATTKSFVEEGLWRELKSNIQPNDLVIIQFGHNDQKELSGVTPNGFYINLTNMISEIRELSGRAILCTPPERRANVQGEWKQTLVQECLLIERISKEFEVPLIHLNEYSRFSYENSLTIEGTKKYFTWLGVNEYPRYPVGLQDDTHFSLLGGELLGKYIYLRISRFIRDKSLFNDIYYGACMYPELISEELLDDDIKHMNKLGMNFARIGEFIWEMLEPEEGVYDFSRLAHYLEKYQENNISVVLCIPTPTPPRWLTYQHPERCIKNIDGSTMVHGSRQHVCTNNDYFRQRAYLLTQKIAKLADKFNNIIGIQLDNEFKCHVDMCYCEACKKKWHQSLKRTYSSINWLNKSWGTDIWSERYGNFEEVPMPTQTPFLHHASLMNAFRKFTADSLNEFARGLCHMIRMETAIPITHNSALGFNLDNFELFAELDYTSFDTYAPASNYPGFTLNIDLWKHVNPDVSEVMLLETSTSNAGHIENYIEPHPKGYLVAEAFAGFAGDLKAFTYWHFRGHRFGVEQPHSTVINAWGEPGCGYEEVKEIGEMLSALKPHLLTTTKVKSSIGLIYSDHAKRHFNVENGGTEDYRTLITNFYASFIKQGISLEVIPERSDNYQDYQVLLVPYLRAITPSVLEKLKRFVNEGGKLILGPLTGDRTVEMAWPSINGLDILGEWLNVKNIHQFISRNDGKAQQWQGLLTALTLNDDWKCLRQLSDEQVIWAKKQVENGSVVYLGGITENIVEDAEWASFVQEEIYPHYVFANTIKVSEGIVLYVRESFEGNSQYYLANMTGDIVNYELVIPMKRIDNEIFQSGTYELLPYKTIVLQS